MTMLLEPSYLPLNFSPIPSSSTLVQCNDLPTNCSIAALRGGFRPFPVKRALSRTRTPVVASKRKIEMRTMGSKDVAAVRSMHNANLPLVYPSSFYTHLLISPAFACLVAHDATSATLLGCVSARLFAPYETSSLLPLPTIHILSLVVLPSSRRTGLGKQLLRLVIRHFYPASSNGLEGNEVYVTLHVLDHNQAAIQLYLGLGLKELRRDQGYYRGGLGGAIELGGVVNLDEI